MPSVTQPVPSASRVRVSQPVTAVPSPWPRWPPWVTTDARCGTPGRCSVCAAAQTSWPSAVADAGPPQHAALARLGVVPGAPGVQQARAARRRCLGVSQPTDSSPGCGGGAVRVTNHSQSLRGSSRYAGRCRSASRGSVTEPSVTEPASVELLGDGQQQRGGVLGRPERDQVTAAGHPPRVGDPAGRRAQRPGRGHPVGRRPRRGRSRRRSTVEQLVDAGQLPQPCSLQRPLARRQPSGPA